MAPERREAALVGAVALLAVSPALLPELAWYLDNAPHLLEVALLAEAMPSPGGFVAWSDGANAGMAIGQHNAPLLWAPLAALVALGLPAAPLYQLAALLSNLVFALGALRLGRRLLGPGPAAPLAALLAATLSPDLIGVAGALGGMWPYRLANGLLLAGLATPLARRGVLGQAAWLGAVILGHTFTAVVGLGLAALELVAEAAAGRWGPARRGAAGLALAMGLSAAFWGPLLDPSLRAVEGFWAMGALDTLGLLFTPMEIMPRVMHGRWEAVGGGAALPGWGLLLAGAALGLARRGPLADPALGRLIAAGLALLVLGVAVLHAQLGFSLLGPNPWRHYAWWRLGLALLAGWGLAPWLGAPRRAAALGLTLGALAAGAGLAELSPHRDADRAALVATWAQAGRALPPGRVYHQDSFHRPGVAEGLRLSHPGGLMALHLDRPVLGSWYAVYPLPTLLNTISETGLLFGVPEHEIPDTGWLWARMRLYGVVGVITVEPGLRARLAADPRFVELGGEGGAAVFKLVDPPLPMVGLPPGEGELLGVDDRGALVRARLSAPGPVRARVRKTWHPWWEARLDGEPAPVLADPGSGLMFVELPHGGELELRWRDRGAPWRWTSLASALIAAALAAAARRGRLAG